MSKHTVYLLLKNHHPYISAFANCVGIFATLILFINWGYFGQSEKIGQFAILSVIYFLSCQVTTFGVDLNIISYTKKLDYTGIKLDKRIFFPFFSFVIISLIFWGLNYFLQKSGNKISEFNLLITCFASGLSVFNQVLMGYIQRHDFLVFNALTYLSKHSGFFLGCIALILFGFEISFFFLLAEIVCLLFMIFSISFGMVECFFDFKGNEKYKKTYFLSGISQFSYSGLFKCDAIVIFILSDLKALGYYTILSSVCEGLINFKFAFHPTIHNYYRGKIGTVKNPMPEATIERIGFVGKLIGISICPCYLILNFAVFNEFPTGALFFASVLMSISVLLASQLFLRFFVFSVYSRPLLQLNFSLSIIVVNIILDILFFKLFGLAGIALATGLTYLIFCIAQTKILGEIDKQNS